MKSLISIFVKYFVRGVILLVPAVATVYVIFQAFIYIDGIIPYEVPGLGLLTLIITLTLFGALASTVLARPMLYWTNNFLRSAPLVKTIYTAIKDLVSAFVGQKKRFDRPVLVKMHDNSPAMKLGFLTAEDLSELGISEDKVGVYLPHSYAFSGNLFIVPKTSITPIDASSADVMKFIVSGGVSEINEIPEAE